jgi:subtilisin family serine protease
MLVPGLDILPPGGARAAVHFSGTDDFEQASFKGVFAFSDDAEVAIVKRFRISGINDQTDPVFAGKYRVRPNMAVAAIVDPNDGYKDSVMLLSGLPGNRVVLGVGTNVAMSEREKKAGFGRYDQTGTEVDPVFFIMGASLNLDLDTKLTIDYAGNDFCVGVRHAFDETISFDFGVYTPDRIHSECRYLVGANFGF